MFVRGVIQFQIKTYKYHAVNFKLNSKQIEIFVLLLLFYLFNPLLQGAKLQADFFPYFSV